MSAYTVIQSGASLWTVGFNKPDGTWEPESDYSSEREAQRRAWTLNGVEGCYVYWRSEPGLWTVGEVGGRILYPHSDHDSWADAAAKVIELNG